MDQASEKLPISEKLIAKRWYDAASRVACGTLRFTAPDGSQRAFEGKQPGPDASFAISEWEVLRRIAARGDIALGEEYIAGRWQTDSIEALVSLFLINLEHFEGFAHGNIFNRIGFVLLNALVRRNSPAGSRRNIQAHYDVGNAFYGLWLDETMTYSSALYENRDLALRDAQLRKYARILGRFGTPRSSVLEIGCGWGGFAEQAAEQGHDVTGLTVSPAQHAFAVQRLNGKADLRLQDYRDVRGTYDTIVSIEMFEAVGERYWPQFFRVVAERLKRGGRAVIQTITIDDSCFEDYRRRSDFIRHYVFPGGMLPSLRRFKDEAERAGLKCADVFAFGQDYARTLRQWSSRLTHAEAAVLAQGHDKAFLRNWQFYLGICAASFAVSRTNVVQVELAHA